MSNLKENTIRSVLFSKFLDFNHTLNRMNFLGAMLILMVMLVIGNVALMNAETFVGIVAYLMLITSFAVLQCKVLLARMNEFIANRSVSIAIIIAAQSLAFIGGFMAEGGDDAIENLGRVLYCVQVVVLLFTPPSKPEGTVVVA